MAVDVKATLRKALEQLQQQREKIDEQIAGVESLLGPRGRGGRRRVAGRKPGARKRRRLSAAQRRAVSKRMKAYWAKRKAAKSK